ncbi:hypothetical protein MPLB_1680099 [Mesorhizobium sp. ORS 3324]|nr:hypothetical protein MPLB_1680099 [Mesorhizobium sp. ORS 3324]
MDITLFRAEVSIEVPKVLTGVRRKMGCEQAADLVRIEKAEVLPETVCVHGAVRNGFGERSAEGWPGRG